MMRATQYMLHFVVSYIFASYASAFIQIHNGNLYEQKQIKISTFKLFSDLDEEVCAALTIWVCGATACANRRRKLGMDEFATVGALYGRKEQAGAKGLVVEEGSCLGRCKSAPCVAVEHEDYEGHVALEGMSDAEFGDQLFHNVVTEDDCDRVWECVENAIHQLAEMEDDDDDE
mmetsp:Transcript_33052/g.38277  ORF Transcript_33052/g.38277 Transcript_33052/m.38277 type:complete len:174 (-) Transcript_33052:147-668(-)